MVFRLNKSIVFPDPSLAEEDGFLAVGGDLSTERLALAYRLGIFPWFSEGDPICWYSPHERFVIFADEIHVSRSMQRFINSGQYQITEDEAFAEVIDNCANIKRKGETGTWITAEMKAAYIALHEKGVAHSIEIWHEDKLIGGVYGIAMGKVFCGESMFSLMPNASKLALIHICASEKYELVDCQMRTAHLESMGGRYISRAEYSGYLAN